jgi:hypothetical protein
MSQFKEEKVICCKCCRKVKTSDSVYMISKTNKHNILKEDLYCCYLCYSIFAEIKKKCVKEFKIGQFKDMSELWLYVFFDVFLKEKEKVLFT